MRRVRSECGKGAHEQGPKNRSPAKAARVVDRVELHRLEGPLAVYGPNILARALPHPASRTRRPAKQRPSRRFPLALAICVAASCTVSDQPELAICEPDAVEL